MSSSSSQGTWKWIIGMIAVTVVLFGGLTWLILKAPADERGNIDQNVNFNDVNDPSVGPAKAAVVVREESDFECPYCQQAEPVMRAVIAKYQDRVRFVWKDFPLPQHHNALIAANAARCAQDQGKYEAYRATLFDKQAEWVNDTAHPAQELTQYAADLGLNRSAFAACLSANADNGKIQADMQEGLNDQVDSTPTFFVNKRSYGAMSEAQWKTILDQALASSATSTSSS